MTVRTLSLAFAALLLAHVAAAQTCPPPGSRAASIQQIREQKPEWNDLDDQQVVSVLKQVYYPDLSLAEVACAIGVAPPSPSATAPQPLTAGERRRFMACQTEATKAPTQYGVQQAMRLCREQFQQ